MYGFISQLFLPICDNTVFNWEWIFSQNQLGFRLNVPIWNLPVENRLQVKLYTQCSIIPGRSLICLEVNGTLLLSLSATVLPRRISTMSTFV